jgi:hypothetical protein
MGTAVVPPTTAIIRNVPVVVKWIRSCRGGRWMVLPQERGCVWEMVPLRHPQQHICPAAASHCCRLAPGVANFDFILCYSYILVVCVALLEITLITYALLGCFYIAIDISADLFHLLVDCLPTLSVIQTGQRRIIEWLWIMKWKVCERYRSCHYSGHCSSIRGTEENHENLNNNSRFPGQDSNPALAEYESEGLLL